ncbi:MAG: FeoB-associated Cys-rich membrane protein [Candidatus Accumulibacter sp.]|jgi:hypothetical protein|nr:FeoB-associated Cys-rich membrane protein [Accumulibacter sp.]
MNLGTFITGALVLCIAAIALWRVLKSDKKSCCGDCAGCGQKTED